MSCASSLCVMPLNKFFAICFALLLITLLNLLTKIFLIEVNAALITVDPALFIPVLTAFLAATTPDEVPTLTQNETKSIIPCKTSLTILIIVVTQVDLSDAHAPIPQFSIPIKLQFL